MFFDVIHMCPAAELLCCVSLTMLFPQLLVNVILTILIFCAQEVHLALGG